MKRFSAVLLVVLAACSNPTEPERIDYASIDMEIVSGQSQVARVANMLPEPCSVLVTKASAAGGQATPAEGVLVNFVITGGDGSVFAGAAITDSAGVAAERWTLGTTVGMHSMEARAVKPDGTPVLYETFVAEAQPGPIATYQVDVASWGAFVGDSLAVDERLGHAEDIYGNAIDGIPFRLTVESLGVGWNGEEMWASKEVQAVPGIWVEMEEGEENINAGGHITFSFLNDLREYLVTVNGDTVLSTTYGNASMDLFASNGWLDVDFAIDSYTYDMRQLYDAMSYDGLDAFVGPRTSTSPITYEVPSPAGGTITVVAVPR